MKRYVLGFLFDASYEHVVLIEKQKPEWQKGLFNGVGGHSEDYDQSAGQAMVREFQEETGVTTQESDWRNFCLLQGKDFVVDCFVGTGDVTAAVTKTEEAVYTFPLWELPRLQTVENLRWLIPLALDSSHDGRPYFTIARYP